MMTLGLLHAESESIECRKRAVGIVFQAVNFVPKPVTAEAVMSEIKRLCGTDTQLENAALAVLASAMMLTVKRKVAQHEAH